MTILIAPSITLHHFYFNAMILLHNHPEYRYGQAMFNQLMVDRPDLSEKIRGTENDPFYLSTPKDPKFDKFTTFIEKNWFGDCTECQELRKQVDDFRCAEERRRYF